MTKQGLSIIHTAIVWLSNEATPGSRFSENEVRRSTAAFVSKRPREEPESDSLFVAFMPQVGEVWPMFS